MKNFIFFLLPVLLLMPSCKSTLTSNKLSGYDKQIEGELEIYMAYISSKEKDKLFEGMKDRLIDKLSEKGIKAKVTILKSDDTLFLILNKEDIKTNNSNGLTLLIQETELNTYTKGNYEDSQGMITLTDHLLGKDVWKTTTDLVYKNVLGGTKNAINIYTNTIIRTLEKDGLLAK